MSTIPLWLDDPPAGWSPRRRFVRRPERLYPPRPLRTRRRAGTLRSVVRLRRTVLGLVALVALAAGGPAEYAQRSAGGEAPAAQHHGSTSLLLASLATCTTGSDPGAVSTDGRYRGKYQFDMTTWRSVGGRGDPARATAGEQDRRAQALIARRGLTPWPRCGATALALTGASELAPLALAARR